MYPLAASNLSRFRTVLLGLCIFMTLSGCLVNKKGLYLYIDWITGQNMWFAGGPGIGLDQEGWDEWKGRLNVNFGYFFSSQECR